MNEQVRAVVAGWRRTVDATWPARGGGPGGITIDVLRTVMPNLAADKAEEYLPLLNDAMAQAEIDTPQRQAAFLAQIAHESTELTEFEEGGNDARYKGRGPIQLTGRANYRAAGKALGLDLEAHPEQVADPKVGFRTTAWYWSTNGLNKLADAGDFRGITKTINGGYNGEAARERYYATAKKALGI